MRDAVLLCNARIVLAESTTEPTSILIEDGRVARVFDSSETGPLSSPLIDLNGLTLFPGFLDIHIHGSASVDTMDTTADGLHKIAVFLRNNGVTAWVPTLVPASGEGYERAIRAINDVIDDQKSHLPIPEARILGVHYEGPFVNNQQCGALHREYFRTFKQISDVDSLPTLPHSEAIHLMTLAPEIDGGIALIDELTRRDWIVSIGHTRATGDVLDQALEAGARH